MFSSQEIIKGGLILIAIIVFAENGLFFCFFLPGDYMLFSAGILCGTGDFQVSVLTLTAMVIAAAIAGATFGYYSGSLIGNRLLNAKDSFFFKREFIIKTRYYYIKYAGNTLLIGRFLPIVRTFAPILAGVINMDFKKFMIYNSLGAVLWAGLLIIGGYYLGVKFPQILNYLEYIIFAFIAITSIIVIKGFFSAKKNDKESN